MKRLLTGLGTAALTALSAAAFTAPAAAQMNERPWSFDNRNGAGIANMIKQVEDQDRRIRTVGNASGVVSGDGTGAGTGTGGQGSLTQLVCGGGQSQSTATSNSTCIIMLNASGDLTIGQDSLGSQDATANSQSDTQTSNTTYNSANGDGSSTAPTQGNMSDALSGLTSSGG